MSIVKKYTGRNAWPCEICCTKVTDKNLGMATEDGEIFCDRCRPIKAVSFIAITIALVAAVVFLAIPAVHFYRYIFLGVS